MTRTKTALLAGAAAVALPGLASAQGFLDGFRIQNSQAVSGFYIGAGAGVNFGGEQRLTPNSTLAAPGLLGVNRGRTLFEPGFTGVLSVGYGLGNGLRFEVEGNYRENDFRKVSGFPGAGLQPRSTNGTQRTYGVMGNVFYDFVIPGLPNVIPYIGGGVGYAWNELNDVSVASSRGFALRTRDTEAGLAYQAIGGVAFPITAVPGLSVTAEYRYFAMEHQRFNTRLVSTATGAGLAGGNLKYRNENHSALLGLRYAFNQPRPMPVAAAVAPAPAQPAPARTYLVFFDWDRADLTDRARQIIADAAQNSRRVGTTRIEVSGHADRSGTPAYNQRLSERRAEAVAGELTRNGIGRNEISVQAFGESRPLVPTADNVREPQNRRVEIVLR